MLPRALNHMAVPGLRWDTFLDLAAKLGCVGVEFRNDLGRPLFDGTAPEVVRERAGSLGLRILALAEVKSFNDWSGAKAREAEALMQLAIGCGAEAISLIPRNDGSGRGNGERQANLRLALRELKPMLAKFGLTGLVEPLGFEVSSLRSKAETVEIIEALGAADTFKLAHDTFHHTLAGGGPIFAEHTGIVHISGVADPSLSIRDMRDEHRILVDRYDRLNNLVQIENLERAGYLGPISFEPFAPAIHNLDDPGSALASSFAFISSQLAEVAA